MVTHISNLEHKDRAVQVAVVLEQEIALRLLLELPTQEAVAAVQKVTQALMLLALAVQV